MNIFSRSTTFNRFFERTKCSILRTFFTARFIHTYVTTYFHAFHIETQSSAVLKLKSRRVKQERKMATPTFAKALRVRNILRKEGNDEFKNSRSTWRKCGPWRYLFLVRIVPVLQGFDTYAVSFISGFV